MLKNAQIKTFWMCVCLAGLQPSFADDWPQWMGPSRNGTYAEAGVIDVVPEEGLDVLWRAPVELGYSGPAVVAGRVFVMDYQKETGTSTNNPGGRDALTGKERAMCFDAESGELLWRYEYPRSYSLSFANGPRATPTVDGERVYFLGAEGDLLCLDVATGKPVWKKQLQEEYGAQAPIWGYASHPLIHGDLLYTLAGGQKSAVVALNKHTGEQIWSALTTEDIGYCPAMIYELGGQEQLLIWHSESLNALDPKTGQLSWSYPLQPSYGMSIAAPQLNGNLLFVSGIGETSAMLELDENGIPEQSLWDGKPKIGVYSGSATALFEEDAIYGSDCGSGMFIAVNPRDGSRYWETFQLTTGGDRRASHGTSFVVSRPKGYLIFTETGDLVSAELSPSGFKETGRMHILEPSGSWQNRAVVWSHPAFADQCMFARNDQELVCVSLKAN